MGVLVKVGVWVREGTVLVAVRVGKDVCDGVIVWVGGTGVSVE